MPLKRSLQLPSIKYGPFCMKILQEFITHHNLSKDLPLPTSGLSTHVALSRIFDVILYSMGEEKREEIMKELDQYNMEIPAHFRQ